MKKFKRILFLLGILCANHTLRASTPLHKASEKHNYNLVRKILEAHPEWINVADKEGKTPLHLACSSLLKMNLSGKEVDYDLATIIYLTQRGAHTKAQNKKGENPLHIASKGKFFYPVCQLILIQAEREAKNLDNPYYIAELIVQKDKEGHSALHYAHEDSEIKGLLRLYHKESVLLGLQAKVKESATAWRKIQEETLQGLEP